MIDEEKVSVTRTQTNTINHPDNALQSLWDRNKSVRFENATKRAAHWIR